MNPALPSRSAVAVSLRRAAHQLIDRPLVFEDPIALQIIGREVASAMQKAPERFEGQVGAPTLRAFLAVRSRIAEDALAAAVAAGVRQYVVLGAGLDTFAYRNPWPELHVFEVDTPAMQDWKRLRLHETGIATPASVSFVPVNFEQATLVDDLTRAGLNAEAPTFFSWLGVMPYLTREAVVSTLRLVAPLTRGGGGMAFDYVVPVESLNFFQRARFHVLAKRLADAGEPFQSFFDPAVMRTLLESLGFTMVRDRGPDAINRKYFADRSDDLAVGEMGHVVTASWSAE